MIRTMLGVRTVVLRLNLTEVVQKLNALPAHDGHGINDIGQHCKCGHTVAMGTERRCGRG